MIQPSARVVGNPGGPLCRGRDECFLHGILRGGEIIIPTGNGAEHLRRELAQQVPEVAVVGTLGSRVDRRRAHDLTYFDGMIIGAPPGPGADDTFAAIS